MIGSLALALVAAGLGQTSARASAPPATLPTRVTRVALFKNGLGVFTRVGAAPDTPGDYLLPALPPPVHGSVWTSSAEGIRIESVVSEYAEAETEASTVTDLVRANVGQRVVLHLQATGMGSSLAASAGAAAGTVAGTILRLDRAEELDRLRDDQRRGRSPAYPGYGPESPLDAVLIEREDGGVTALAMSSIRIAEFAGKPARSLRRTAPRLRLRFPATRAKGDFALHYAAKGITWAPSYRVDLVDQTRARMSASALVINEAEDLERVRIDLVTGVPNLKLADVLSPLALAPGLAEFLKTLGQDPSQRQYGPMATQSSSYAYPEGSGPGLPRYGVATTGTAQEDLFLYPLPEVTLAKGSVGWYPLFSETVPFQHLYQWEIPDYVSEDETYAGRGQRDQVARDDTRTVWHAVRLENTTPVPWTTAPAQTVRGETLLGQDVLGYTPRGAPGTLRITRALEVRAEESEVETGRQAQALQLYGSYFDRVTLSGSLEVVNGQDRAIDLEIKKSISGELGATSPAPRVTRQAKGLKRQNPSLELVWQLTLAPGATSRVKYTYAVLVRR